jgi:hypothetical protein
LRLAGLHGVLAFLMSPCAFLAFGTAIRVSVLLFSLGGLVFRHTDNTAKSVPVKRPDHGRVQLQLQKRQATPPRTGTTPMIPSPPSTASIARASPNTLRPLPIGIRTPPPK